MVRHLKEKYLYLYLFIIFYFFGLYYNSEQAYNLIRILGLVTIIVIPFLARFKKDKFSFYIISFFIYSVIEMVISTFRYNTSILTMVLFSSSYFVLPSYFIFNKIDREKLVKILCFISSLSISILAVQYFFYNNFGVEFLFKFSELPVRMDVQRIYVGIYIIPFVFLISLSRIIIYLNNKSKIPKLYLISLFLSLFDLYFFVMTRSFLVLILLISSIMILLFLKTKIKIYFIIILSFLLYFAYSTFGIFDKYIEFQKDVDTDTLSIRYEAIGYYLNKTTDDNPFLGFGYIRTDNSALENLLHGANGEYYREDVGIFGFYNNFGLIGIIWMLGLFYTMLKIVINKYRDKTIFKKPEYLAIVLMFILSEVTSINFINYDGIASFPLILLLLKDSKTDYL